MNIESQQRAGELINSGDVDAAVDVLFAPDAVDHDPASGQGPGRDGFRAMFHALRTAFPDLRLTPEVLTADDQHVALAYTITGTHRGHYLGVPPTGRPIQARGVQVARFADGRIVERWGSSDELGILRQLG